jgi:hypothetical protein
VRAFTFCFVRTRSLFGVTLALPIGPSL